MAALRIALVALALAAAFAPSALAAPAPGMGAPTTIVAKESGCPGGKTFCFDPASLEVGGGQLPFILDNSRAQQPHNLCFDVKGTISCAPGPSRNDYAPAGSTNATVTVTFNEAGRFPYWCDVPGHRLLGMEGNITVSGASLGGPANGTGSGSGSGGSGTGGGDTCD